MLAVFLFGRATWEICYNQSEALPRFGKWLVISMEFCARSPDVISRKTNSGVAECRLFSWAAFKSNHHHSELTNRNVALRDAHCNSRIWIFRRKRYQRKEWEQRKGLYFWRYSVDCCAHVIGSCCARGKTYCTFNTRDISWDGGDIFCALNVGFGRLASQKQKTQHWEVRSKTFCRKYVYSTGCPSLLWRELVLENLSLSQYKSLV